MKLSIAITTHNEGDYFENLLGTLKRQVAKVDYEYEFVVLDDNSQDPKLLSLFEQNSAILKVVKRPFDGDFAAHKNALSDACSGDYIFQIDADEVPADRIVVFMDRLVTTNPNVDVYGVPRVNTVKGITEQHVRQWGWSISSIPSIVADEVLDTESRYFELLQQRDLIMHYDYSGGQHARTKYMLPIVNWPDIQLRIWKNVPSIRWAGKVHERLVGHSTIASLPVAVEFALFHHKDIQRQERQNTLYAQLGR